MQTIKRLLGKIEKNHVHFLCLRVKSEQLTAIQGHKKAAPCKPGREPSPEANHSGSLISDLQPPGLWENKFLLSQLPCLVLFHYSSLDISYSWICLNLWGKISTGMIYLLRVMGSPSLWPMWLRRTCIYNKFTSVKYKCLLAILSDQRNEEKDVFIFMMHTHFSDEMFWKWAVS
jgi:hypothetical protein